MSKNTAILDILHKWPSRKDLAADMGKDIVVIHRWFQRSSIPPEYDARLIDAASARNIPLNWRELMNARSPSCEQSGHSDAISQGVET